MSRKTINGVQIVRYYDKYKLVLLKQRCIVKTYGIFDTQLEAVNYKYHQLNIRI